MKKDLDVETCLTIYFNNLLHQSDKRMFHIHEGTEFIREICFEKFLNIFPSDGYEPGQCLAVVQFI